MPHVTLILTRTPLDEFVLIGGQNEDVTELSDEERLRLYIPRHAAITAKPSIRRKSGRWGSMLMIRGPQIAAASFATWTPPGSGAPVRLAGRALSLLTDGSPITKTTEFTTLERYRGSFGSLEQSERFVMMPARDEHYPLKVERGNHVVKTLRPGHSGDCLRVYGGETKKQRGILIHEAPSIGYVVGCIGPRTKGDKGSYGNTDLRNPSLKAMNIILQEMIAIGHGKGRLFVLP